MKRPTNEAEWVDWLRQRAPRLAWDLAHNFAKRIVESGADDEAAEDYADIMRTVAASRHEERKRARTRQVYFLKRYTDGAIKIGVSYRPEGRASDMRMKFKTHVELLATLPGDVREEQILHARFVAERFEGEWFKPSERLLDFIAAVHRGEVKEVTL